MWFHVPVTLDWYRAMPRTARGMLLMLAATICFTVMQGAIRYVANVVDGGLAPFEVAFFRNFFGLVVLIPLFIRGGPRVLGTARFPLHLGRSVCQSIGMLCFFTALTMIPIAEVTALSFSAPLFAAVLAVLVLGERLHARRISALALGFTGVLVILQPGIGTVSPGAMLVIASSLAWAASMAIIKMLSRTESPLTMTVYAGLLMSPATLILALFVWQWPTPAQFGWLLLIGLLGSTGQMAFAQSFKLAEMGAVLPLDFTRLVWASLIGFIVFAERPSIWTWMGGAMIFGAASYITVREARLSRRSGA